MGRLDPMITRVLVGCVFACGVFGAWAAGRSPWSEQAIDRSVGVAAILAFILAAIAMSPRSWARAPLLATCAIAGVLTKYAFFDEHEPGDVPMFEYFALNILVVFAAGAALLISIVEHEKRTRAAWRSRGN